MGIRIGTVATAAAVLTLAGCSSEDSSENTSAPPESSAPSTPVTAAADDEQQIRDLVDAQTDAFAAGDWAALADLTCSEFRERVSDPGQFLVPPLDMFGPREQVTSLSPAQVSDLLAQRFGSGVSPETLDRVAQAIVAYDDAAYRDAMLDLMTESTTVTVDNVENIEIDGDSATADITTTRVMGDNPPATSTDSTPYVREDGEWLDCSDPSGQ
ncbi:nuclear transport factor 2 family protein [Mycobacterium sp. Y57]|uniref:nuclear transport factor 2 family protein n=1 Tax=Mycolicibacterium xanthum TaxID=2796469 RepID=UPI001C849F8F|nr:nuclear transport factor 2 family protein [Mycolicibacterium xanthum]MBX7433596.1 nuclear transport factor 2 family protein [Mycolicibacterium xanthum]